MQKYQAKPHVQKLNGKQRIEWRVIEKGMRKDEFLHQFETYFEAEEFVNTANRVHNQKHYGETKIPKKILLEIMMQSYVPYTVCKIYDGAWIYKGKRRVVWKKNSEEAQHVAALYNRLYLQVLSETLDAQESRT
ncbi:hypothetical protein [Eel River basin pequenovirus]|nr:hypothetical protein [Eel River basin pequenovirus]